jgi:hypothetical protein
VTGALHFQVNACATQELLIDPLSEGISREGTLYSDGAHIKDLKEVRDLLYRMQCPAIAPSVRAFFIISFFSNADSLTHALLCLVGVSTFLEVPLKCLSDIGCHHPIQALDAHAQCGATL